MNLTIELFTIRKTIQENLTNIKYKESGIFAWIPTMTSVSRQAIFAGKIPLYFPNSINTTNNESNLWRQFWESHGMHRSNIIYKRGLGDGDPISEINSIIIPGKTKILGLVIDKIDKIMHGMQLGSSGMQNQIKHWCKQGYLPTLISYLLDNNYKIWITSDHGNIECKGKGRPLEGSIAENRAERVRIYPTAELRSKVSQLYSFSKEWQATGLPSNYYPLIISGGEAFVKEGELIVAHGGVSLEEVIVPLIKIERE